MKFVSTLSVSVSIRVHPWLKILFNMTHNGKTTRPTVRNAVYDEAFAHLDAALAINTRSRVSDIEKIDRLRRAVFGELPEDGPGDVNAFDQIREIRVYGP